MLGLFLLVPFATAQEDCPDGQERSAFTQDQCCWPGQAWNGKNCVGIPRCPEGMRTLPDRCAADEVRSRPRAPAVATRNVVFPGGDYSGQTLFVGEEELGRLPNAFLLPLGEHTWTVKNAVGGVLAQGTVKIREGEGDQVVRMKPVAVVEEDE